MNYLRKSLAAWLRGPRKRRPLRSKRSSRNFTSAGRRSAAEPGKTLVPGEGTAGPGRDGQDVAQLAADLEGRPRPNATEDRAAGVVYVCYIYIYIYGAVSPCR